jgi:hypothetical protein
MSWIAPNNVNLNAVVGMNNGLGLNPFPTFDWNILLWDSPPQDPLIVPFFNTFNKFIGSFLAVLVILGVWYTNSFNTGYLPINSNRVFDNTGGLFNVSKVINKKGLFDAAKYEAYSQANLSASYAVVYMFFFAIYTATISHAYLYHRHEIVMGFRNLYNSIRKTKDSEYEYTDVHNRLMSAYAEG